MREARGHRSSSIMHTTVYRIIICDTIGQLHWRKPADRSNSRQPRERRPLRRAAALVMSSTPSPFATLQFCYSNIVVDDRADGRDRIQRSAACVMRCRQCDADAHMLMMSSHNYVNYFKHSEVDRACASDK